MTKTALVYNNNYDVDYLRSLYSALGSAPSYNYIVLLKLSECKGVTSRVEYYVLRDIHVHVIHCHQCTSPLNLRKIHRIGAVVTRLVGRARGPALFNPATRLPAEAYNYQFPVGSVRSDSSASSSTSSSSSRRTPVPSRSYVGTSGVYLVSTCDLLLLQIIVQFIGIISIKFVLFKS